MINNDGCSACSVDVGYSCNAAGNVCTPICGDGKVVGNENCDDGVPPIGITGCNAGCTTGAKFGYTCVGGSSSTATTCT